MKITRIISVGLAVFTMLFGAGNIVFPLMLGRETGTQVLFAIIGLALTGIAVPMLGLIVSMMYEGNYRKFFEPAGTYLGAFFAFLCMLILGPFGATPRCITVAYAAVYWHMPFLSPFAFNLIIAGIVFSAAFSRGRVVDIFGKFFGPIKCVLLFSIVVIGLFTHLAPPVTDFTAFTSFLHGFNEGYLTLDLIATIFFAGLIVNSIKTKSLSGEVFSPKKIMRIGLTSSLIGGGLLALVYSGFCLLAAKYAVQIADVRSDQLLSALATLVLGQRAGILADATMAIACLTTAIALTAVFADYVMRELLFGKISYTYALLLTVTVVFVTSNLGFEGIAHIIEPAAIVLYPSLIVLSVTNLMSALYGGGLRYVKQLVYATFVLTLCIKFFPWHLVVGAI